MRTWFSVVAAGICCLFLTASMANAATIYACKKKVGGTVRIVKAATVCLATETKISLADAAQVATLETQVAALVDLLQHFSRNGNDVAIIGANLYIIDGSGYTDGGGTVNGLGNLIVGYNELRGSGDDRTGSHNIVVGRRNNYTRYGGLVVGEGNTISNDYSSVSGGYSNTASGQYSSVSGGEGNTASGYSSSVGGGEGNTASGSYSSVGGGFYRSALTPYDWVAGLLFTDF